MLLERVRSAVAGIDPALPMDERVRLGVAANVRQTVDGLLEIVARENQPEDVRALIVGGIYDLDTGRVEILQDTHSDRR